MGETSSAWSKEKVRRGSDITSTKAGNVIFVGCPFYLVFCAHASPSVAPLLSASSSLVYIVRNDGHWQPRPSNGAEGRLHEALTSLRGPAGSQWSASGEEADDSGASEGRRRRVRAKYKRKMAASKKAFPASVELKPESASTVHGVQPFQAPALVPSAVCPHGAVSDPIGWPTRDRIAQVAAPGAPRLPSLQETPPPLLAPQ